MGCTFSDEASKEYLYIGVSQIPPDYDSSIY